MQLKSTYSSFIMVPNVQKYQVITPDFKDSIVNCLILVCMEVGADEIMLVELRDVSRESTMG